MSSTSTPLLFVSHVPLSLQQNRFSHSLRSSSFRTSPLVNAPPTVSRSTPRAVLYPQQRDNKAWERDLNKTKSTPQPHIGIKRDQLLEVIHDDDDSLLLGPKEGFPERDGPVALIIMDGVGLNDSVDWNAVSQAHTPFLDSLLNGEGVGEGTSSYVSALEASGMSVGLPTMKDMGNSEVGHNALGAGRVFDQGAKLVNNAFETGSFRNTDTWRYLVEKGDKQTLHLIGLLSDGGVHSHTDHVNKLIDAAVRDGVKRVRVHCLVDGRDVSEKSALIYLGPLEEKCKQLRDNQQCDIHIASVGGRMTTTMDRYEANWDMVENGYHAHCLGNTDKLPSFKSSIEGIEYFYNQDDSMVDQYIPPFVIVDEQNQPIGKMDDGDSVFFWNYRGDRSIQISQAFEDEDFPHFDRTESRPKDLRYAGMMQYDGDSIIPKRYLIEPPEITRTLGEYIVSNNKSRYSISETQKYGHVTYFFNGNRSSKFDEDLEKYVCIESYKEKEDTRPWMKSAEITDDIINTLNDPNEKNFDFMVINYPNGDMVGHTGNMNASKIAMQCLDLCLSRVIPEIVNKHNGIVVLTADHGNCEGMAELDKNGQPKKGNQPQGWKANVSHTKNKVPLVIIGKDLDNYTLDADAKWSETNPNANSAGLVNLPSTILNLMGLEEPKEFLPPLLKVKVQKTAGSQL